ncbi:M48 family metalloprotease [Erwiniaceae bacterium BAC15a-03b]|uniref:M48 family metalloprotease n=1 Tax=Winslowiella arboricola TaxID=2978220 RepID=A0A9J6PFW1_9GAMM|nr:M48 family metallopeptidase [Winslowiella arboricola]MCU5771285.1 M48 family metalloprotease [Winslowiella arboricola]MCU5776266.1 M48 family metalloprotease [Winslowiella arboricola]
MNKLTAFKKGYLKVFLLVLLTLFLIPFITLVFSEYGKSQLDKQYTEILINDARQQNSDVAGLTAFLQLNPPSSVCGAVDRKLSEYHNAVCATGSELEQFFLIDKLAIGTLIAGAAILLLVMLFSALAFTRRKGQYWSLMLVRPFLVLASLMMVAVQGVMLVWLSYWITAFFTQTYYPKVVFITGLMALAGIYYVIRGIFKRLPTRDEVEGEVVRRAAAPELWARIDALAAQVGTTPPDHIIAGIDTNFYVTEGPLRVKQQSLGGRKLYVSIPLLRQLTLGQADGVMVHELTHLYEGDTSSGALLGPKLQRFDNWTHMMGENFPTLVVYYLACLYRMLFELASQRDSREREFIADRNAARLITPAAIIESLIKISAYASYRGEVERSLFGNKKQYQQELGISKAIAAGLPEHVNSTHFISIMREQNIPHPYDSHPPLSERMRNVGYTLEEDSYAAIAAALPTQSWVDLMPVATEIEQQLWQKYEGDFSSAHEESLAWSYEPVGAEETALVLKYFPPVVFPLKGGLQVEISYRGVTHSQSAELLEWGNIKSANHRSRFGTDIVHLQHYQPNAQGEKRSLIRLPGIKKEIAAFNQTFGLYWNRHQNMRALLEQEPVAATEG